MKKAVLIFVIFFISCGKSAEEQMFYDFMDALTTESVGKSIKDLNFKILSLKKTGVVTAKDSITILEEKRLFLEGNMQERTSLIINDLKTIKELEEKIDNTPSAELKSNYQAEIDKIKSTIDSRREILDNHESSFKKILADIKRLEKDSTLIVSTKYEVSYSMENPSTKDGAASILSEAYTNAENSKFVLLKDF